MKRISTLVFSIACLALSIGAAAQQPGMKANIPFNFTVGDTNLPAGEYTISSPIDQVIRLRSSDNATGATVVSLHCSEAPGSNSTLVFRRYGDRYFLHRVLSASYSSMDLDVPSGKAEKEARSSVAKLQAKQEVLVAAR
jgi:hypothetical protein